MTPRGEMPEGPSVNPLVTVVCSTYNSKATLRCALRSVLNQDFRDFEVRVVGDACTDGTGLVVEELNDPRLHWFNFPANSGSQSEPNNEGIRRARGRYIAFIGHDDLWFPWHLSQLVRHLEETRADMVHDLVASIGPNSIEGVSGKPRDGADYARVYFPTSSWLHRRELCEEVGFWRKPDHLAWPIDFDFTHRVAQARKNIQFVPSLGVLKFHSVVWKTYSRTESLPQEPWLRSILERPAELKDTLLNTIAAQYAEHFQWNDKLPLGLAWKQMRSATGATVKACIREALFWYGPDRWPVGPLRRYRMKRLRARMRIGRGLASNKR